jgi:sugar phosphate isomerase/epimerase
MRISCSSLFLWEFQLEYMVDVLRKSGIECIEFWVETPCFWLKRDRADAVDELAHALSKLEDCTLHVPILDLNPSSYNDGVSEATLKESLWSIQLAHELGAELVTLHPGSRTVHREPTQRDWEKFRCYLRECCNLASTLDVTLALENITPRIQNMCATVGEMRAVLEEFSGLMFTFDIMHALSFSFEHALSFLELSEYMLNVHVGNVRDGMHHLPLHRGGNVEIEKILYTLREVGYDGFLTMEINDLVYERQLSSEDKVSELSCEREYLERIFKQGRV